MAVFFTPQEAVGCVLALGVAAAGTPILFRSSQRMIRGRRILSARFGGLSLVPAIALGWIYITSPTSPFVALYGVMIAATLLLLLVAWMTTLHRLPPYPGYVVRVGTVIGAMLAMPDRIDILPGLSMLAERLVLCTAWIGFLFAHGQIGKIKRGAWMASFPSSIAIFIIGLAAGQQLASHALIMALALIGFGLWHLWGAKVALGHTGGWPLGFVLGGLLVMMVVQGFGLSALVLALPVVGMAFFAKRLEWRFVLLIQVIAGFAALGLAWAA